MIKLVECMILFITIFLQNLNPRAIASASIPQQSPTTAKIPKKDGNYK